MRETGGDTSIVENKNFTTQNLVGEMNQFATAAVAADMKITKPLPAAFIKITKPQPYNGQFGFNKAIFNKKAAMSVRNNGKQHNSFICCEVELCF